MKTKKSEKEFSVLCLGCGLTARMVQEEKPHECPACAYTVHVEEIKKSSAKVIPIKPIEKAS